MVKFHKAKKKCFQTCTGICIAAVTALAAESTLSTAVQTRCSCTVYIVPRNVNTVLEVNSQTKYEFFIFIETSQIVYWILQKRERGRKREKESIDPHPPKKSTAWIEDSWPYECFGFRLVRFADFRLRNRIAFPAKKI